ncbi:MFS transporter [Streptomyces clavuligerus]|uniref:MFS transporter n=1 Tax=Streptomyces clavuligerus TaxID=1901 RepID=UPI00020D91B5|nr:MFS transporter [Streptomyces clavuligerus]ANW22237.1 multidrug transporter [Streptomyces clavuligerus]
MRPGYRAAALVFAVGMAGATLPTPLYGLYRAELGFSELTVTLVFAVYGLSVIGTLLFAGDLSDRFGRRPVLLLALGCSAASDLCFLLEGGLPLLYAGRAASGVSAGLLSGAATAAVLELAPPGGEKRAGFAATAANMGGLGCGPLLAGVLAQYAPAPLRTPFLAHLALLALVVPLAAALPETVDRARRTDRARPDHRRQDRRRERRPRERPRSVAVPPGVRGVFVPAATAAFTGFALLGLFTAVAPAFLSETLGERNHAVTGAVVFSVFLASTLGQSLTGRLGVRRALPTGCLVLVAGLLLVGGSLAAESLPLLLAGALIGGFGQGLAFRAALTSVGSAAPPAHRAATISAFFVVAYVGISLPIVGVGALSLPLGLRDAGMLFTAVFTVAALTVALLLARAPRAGKE